MIRAAVEKATPTIESTEMILIKFFFLFEKKYRLAMKRERFMQELWCFTFLPWEC
jgi:hypothetical protein